MAKKEQIFDFEVFPNWWCCVIGEYPQDEIITEELKDKFYVVTSDDSAARERLRAILCRPDFVSMGYNIKHYDNKILWGVMNGFTPREIGIMNKLIIHPELCATQEYYGLSYITKKQYDSANFVYQDMLDDNDGSLKEKESALQLDIRESEVDFNKANLIDEDKENTIFYCKHDVWSSMIFYCKILKPFIQTKLLVGKTFNIPEAVCYKSTNAGLSALANGAVRTSFADKNRIDIEIPAELKQYIEYNLPKEVVTHLKTRQDKLSVVLYGNDVSYANGGVHSVICRPKEIANKKLFPSWFVHIKSGNGWSLINVDAGSFYPNLMVAWHGLSRAIPDASIFANMIKERLRLKSIIGPFEDKYGKHPELAPEEERAIYINAKETSQAYKLILNTTYGASGNKWLDLYDPYMTTYTCRLGQLLLTALGNCIYTNIGKKNVQIIQTNTDGLLIYIKDEYIDMLHAFGKQWEDLTHIPLEFENEYEIWQRDVNNYVMGKQNGKVKSKGGFFVTDTQQPGYNRIRPLSAYVCRQAMINYISKGTNIVEHIYNESDLSKFAIGYSKGVYSGIIRKRNDGPDDILNKSNRIYASLNKNYGMIMKISHRNNNITENKAPGCPPHCALINDALYKYDMNEIRNDLDYMWYISETVDMLSSPWYELINGEMEKSHILDNLLG